MKKMLTLCLAALGLFVASPAFADTNYSQDQDNSNNYVQGTEEQQASGQEFACGEHKVVGGDCYCLYCKYKPCYYNETRTICEPQCYQEKCCRMVPQNYEKCCVKYVPQYYTQTCCRYVPQYYTVTKTRNCYRKVCEKKCKYVPQYFYKHVCAPACAPACEPACAPACPTGGCAQ